MADPFPDFAWNRVEASGGCHLAKSDPCHRRKSPAVPVNTDLIDEARLLVDTRYIHCPLWMAVGVPTRVEPGYDPEPQQQSLQLPRQSLTCSAEVDPNIARLSNRY